MGVDPNLTEEQKKKTLVNIREFVNATKDCVDVGMYILAKLHPSAAVFLGVAYTVKNLISIYAIDENSEVTKELKELRTKMDAMLDRMANHFTAFKAFYVENQFWNEVPLQTSVLFQYMLDVQTNPSERSLKEFIRQYKKTDPVELARKLNYQLQRELMNPLKHAMAADPLMTTKTFDKWQQIIENVFMQLWEIEIKAGVWIHKLDVKEVDEMDRVKDVQDEIEKYHVEVQKWDEAYEKNAPYWPDKVRQFAEDMLEKHSSKSNKEKAQAIAEQLDQIRTKAEFYVLVYPEWRTVKYENKPNQYLLTKRAGCTAVVYRSLQAYQQNDGLLRYAHTNLRLYNKEISEAAINRAEWIEERHLKAWTIAQKTGFRQCGVLIAVQTDKSGGGVDVAWSKSKLHNDAGCGGYVYGSIRHQKTGGLKIPRSTYFFMFAGYQ